VEVLGLATGFFFGVRHCLEPDHLTAVAHFASAARTRGDGLRSGLLWGVGHSMAVVLLVFALAGLRGPLEGLAPAAERAVGGTLIALSIWRIRALLRRPHVHPHEHDDGFVHSHSHTHHGSHVHLHAPTLVGFVHGTAGALGVAAVCLAVPSVSVALFAAAFVAGTLAAMGAAGWLAAHVYARAQGTGWERPVTALTATCGLVLGAFWIVAA
jgi:hypothetical protein